MNLFEFAYSHSMFFSLFIGLLLTIVLEWVVYIIGIKQNRAKLLLYSVLINSFTLPLATYLVSKAPRWHPLAFISSFVVIEIAVFLIESLLIWQLMETSYKKALLISLIANAITAVIGVLLFMLTFAF